MYVVFQVFLDAFNQQAGYRVHGSGMCCEIVSKLCETEK